jgi:hypothetical protein
MTEQEENALRWVTAVQSLTDEQLWIAYSNGYTNPNVDAYHPVVKAVLEGRLLTRIADETEALATGVRRLSDSSDRMERLTKILTRWTVWLTMFAIIQIVFIGVQTWKMFQPERPVQIVVSTPSAERVTSASPSISLTRLVCNGAPDRDPNAACPLHLYRSGTRRSV